MQLWNFAKCSQIAEETDAKASDGYIRICKMRMARIIAAAVCICLLAALAVITVMHSQQREWEEVTTHEKVQIELSADDCVQYSMEMTEGEYVISQPVMPFKSFTINADGEQDTYYVFLDNSGAEGIFHFEGDMDPEVEAWLDGWQNMVDEVPEPVEIIGKRGVMSISDSEETKELAENYNGKSYIELGNYSIEREVEIEGAADKMAQIESEKEEFEARRTNLFTVMCVLFGLFVAVVAAMIVAKQLYDRAVKAFMAENEADN